MRTIFRGISYFLTFSRLKGKGLCNAFEYEYEQWKRQMQVYCRCCGDSAKRIVATLKSTIDVFKYNNVIP